MNKWCGTGRLTRDPEVRYSTNGDKTTAIGRYTLAINRAYKQNGENTADFIPCTAFGKAAEFAEKYFHKGMKIEVTGRLQSGSYTNKDGAKVYTYDIIVEEQNFAESKAAGQNNQASQSSNSAPDDGFMDIPDSIDGEELPFN